MRPNELKIASTYQIGQLCQHFSISPRALRFYEEKGLIAPRRGAHKTRQYSRADFNRVQVISWGRRAALSLEEIRELLDDYDRADNGRRQLDNALDKLREKAARLDAQRTHLAAEIEALEQRLSELGTGAANDVDPTARVATYG
jgi:DNA-binding transcriptional MerR regulator